MTDIWSTLLGIYPTIGNMLMASIVGLSIWLTAAGRDLQRAIRLALEHSGSNDPLCSKSRDLLIAAASKYDANCRNRRILAEAAPLAGLCLTMAGMYLTGRELGSEAGIAAMLGSLSMTGLGAFASLICKTAERFVGLP